MKRKEKRKRKRKIETEELLLKRGGEESRRRTDRQ